MDECHFPVSIILDVWYTWNEISHPKQFAHIGKLCGVQSEIEITEINIFYWMETFSAAIGFISDANNIVEICQLCYGFLINWIY